MAITINEYSDFTSISAAAALDDEQLVFDVLETHVHEDHGEFEGESFQHEGSFQHSLLGEPDGDTDQVADVYDCINDCA